MLLAIDIGNTHLVLGIFEHQILLHTWRFPTYPIRTAAELRAEVEKTAPIPGFRLQDLQAIVIASVVPAATKVAQLAFGERHTQEGHTPVHTLVHTPVHTIDETWPFSFEIKTDSPRVGTDRLVNAEAAVRDYGAPCIIVDSGTATTVCGISKSSTGHAEFLGGAILPGLRVSMEALAKKAALLFEVELTLPPPPRVIGANTPDALRSGSLYGYASMIDGMVQRFKAELNVSELPVIATGGINHLMRGLTKELTHFDFDLTLRGIAYLYDTVSKR